MKVEIFANPDDASRIVYQYRRDESAVELWEHLLHDHLFSVWYSDEPGPPTTDPRNDRRCTDEPVPLCTAQLMALKLLGVEPEGDGVVDL